MTALTELSVGLFVAIPAVLLFWFWYTGRELTFKQMWASLAAHAAAMALPVAWASLILSARVVYKPTSETIIGHTSFFAGLSRNWWMSALLWPAPVLGLIFVSERLATTLASNSPPLRSTPEDVLLLWTTTFGLTLFWGTTLRERPAIRLSDEGLRTGVLHFIEWTRVHHASLRGRRVDIYHAANPDLPLSCITLADEAARATLMEFLERHQVPIRSATPSALQVTRWIVALLMAALLMLGVALEARGGHAAWVVVLTFALGIAFTLVLEKYRGIANVTRIKPAIEPPPPSPESTPPEALDDANVESAMKELADLAVQMARTGHSLHLDYGVESVEKVEQVLAAVHDQHARTPISDLELTQCAIRYGAYIGEVLRRRWGGRWLRDHEVAGPGSFPLETQRGQSFPIGWCSKRLENGPQDNVWHKVQILYLGRGEGGFTVYPDGRLEGSLSALTASGPELHVQIKLAGGGFPSPEELKLRHEVERFIERENLGDLVDAGSGMGVMDVVVRTPDIEAAERKLREFVRQLGIDEKTILKRV